MLTVMQKQGEGYVGVGTFKDRPLADRTANFLKGLGLECYVKDDGPKDQLELPLTGGSKRAGY